MRFLFVFFFTFICHHHREYSRAFEKLGFTHDSNVKNKVFIDYFIVLSAEIKFLILEYLSPLELFDFIKIDEFKDYHQIARRAYEIVYGNVPVIVGFDDVIKSDMNIKQTNDYTAFRNASQFISFLKAFDKHIKNIRIINAMLRLRNELEPVINAVGENCAGTLTRFEIRYIYGTEFYIIKKIKSSCFSVGYIMRTTVLVMMLLFQMYNEWAHIVT